MACRPRGRQAPHLAGRAVHRDGSLQRHPPPRGDAGGAGLGELTLAFGYDELLHTAVGFRIGELRLRTRRALLDQRRADGGVLLRRRAGDQARALRGELSELRRAALPALAALGGMLVPARIYVAVQRAARRRPAAGAFRWRPTSRSRSGSSRCSESACRRRCASCCSPSPSSTISARSSSSRCSIRPGSASPGWPSPPPGSSSSC